MDDEVCKLKHESIDRHLLAHDGMLENHDTRIDALERYQSRTEVQIEHLCKEIGGLITTIKGAVVTSMVTLVGFIIWYIQQL